MTFSHLPIFATDETHGRALRASNRLIVHSPAVGWRSLYGAIIEESPFEATEPPMGHPALIYHLARPTQGDPEGGGRPPGPGCSRAPLPLSHPRSGDYHLAAFGTSRDPANIPAAVYLRGRSR
jgi:hypothetical protein